MQDFSSLFQCFFFLFFPPNTADAGRCLYYEWFNNRMCVDLSKRFLFSHGVRMFSQAQATQAAMDPPTTADGSASASAAGEQENEDSSAAATEVLSTGEDAEDEERDAERMPDIEVLSDDPKDD